MSKLIDTDSWETPDDLFNRLDGEFRFDIDLCASKYNHKCSEYITKDEDLLSFTCSSELALWMNPPYSRGNIDKCMKHAYWLHTLGNTVVCLVRDDPSTKWYNEWVDEKAETVLRLRKRVTFKGGDGCYNFPVCIIIYKKWSQHQLHTHYKQWSIGEEI